MGGLVRRYEPGGGKTREVAPPIWGGEGATEGHREGQGFTTVSHGLNNGCERVCCDVLPYQATKRLDPGAEVRWRGWRGSGASRRFSAQWYSYLDPPHRGPEPRLGDQLRRSRVRPSMLRVTCLESTLLPFLLLMKRSCSLPLILSLRYLVEGEGAGAGAGEGEGEGEGEVEGRECLWNGFS